MTPPVDDYDGLTVADAKARVREGAVTAEALYDYERDNKDRKTLREWIARRLEPDDPAPADDSTSETEPETIRVANTRLGSIAGMHFDEKHVTVEVVKNVRIEEAIKRGDLRVQHD